MIFTASGLLPPPFHPPRPRHKHTPRTSEKSLTDGCTGKIHSGDQNILRHCLSDVWIWRGNYNQRKTGQRKKGHLWRLSYFLSCGTWCVISAHRVFWIIFHLINEHPPPHTTSTPLLKALHLFPVSCLCPQVVENDKCISFTTGTVKNLTVQRQFNHNQLL